MANTVFADAAPKVKRRGDFFVITHTFEGEETHIVLTHTAAVGAAERIKIALDAPMPTAEVIRFKSTH